MTPRSPDGRAARTGPPLFEAAVWQRGERADLRVVYSPLNSLASPQLMVYLTPRLLRRHSREHNRIQFRSRPKKKRDESHEWKPLPAINRLLNALGGFFPDGALQQELQRRFPPNQGLRREILYLLPQNVQEVRNCFLFSLQDILEVG